MTGVVARPAPVRDVVARARRPSRDAYRDRVVVVREVVDMRVPRRALDPGKLGDGAQVVRTHVARDHLGLVLVQLTVARRALVRLVANVAALGRLPRVVDGLEDGLVDAHAARVLAAGHSLRVDAPVRPVELLIFAGPFVISVVPLVLGPQREIGDTVRPVSEVLVEQLDQARGGH